MGRKAEVMGKKLEDAYKAKQQQALRANYRICWSQELGGYFAQFLDSNKAWCNVDKAKRHDSEARLDAILHARQVGVVVYFYPLIANLTEGRREYDIDLSKPYPNY